MILRNYVMLATDNVLSRPGVPREMKRPMHVALKTANAKCRGRYIIKF